MKNTQTTTKTPAVKTVAPAKAKRTSKPVATPAPVAHSCEKVGIHARGMCKGCYRKNRLSIKKEHGMGLKAYDAQLAAQALTQAKRDKRAAKKAAPVVEPAPLAAKQKEQAPETVEFVKKVRKAVAA